MLEVITRSRSHHWHHECITRKTRFHAYCIYRSQPEMEVSWPEAEMSCMVGDGDVLYDRRRRCLVWPETEMSRMAGDDC